MMQHIRPGGDNAARGNDTRGNAVAAQNSAYVTEASARYPLTIDTQLASNELGSGGKFVPSSAPAAHERARVNGGVVPPQSLPLANRTRSTTMSLDHARMQLPLARSLDDSLLGVASPVAAAAFEAFQQFLASLPQRPMPKGSGPAVRSRASSIPSTCSDSLASIKGTLDKILADRKFERKSNARQPADDSYIRREWQQQQLRLQSQAYMMQTNRPQRGQSFADDSFVSSDVGDLGGAKSMRGRHASMQKSALNRGASGRSGVRKSIGSMQPLERAAEELRRQKPDRYRPISTNDDQYAVTGSRHGSQDLTASMPTNGEQKAAAGPNVETRRPSLASLFVQDSGTGLHGVTSPFAISYESPSDTDGYASTVNTLDAMPRLSGEAVDAPSMYHTSNASTLTSSTMVGQSGDAQRPSGLHRHASSSAGSFGQQSGSSGNVPSVTGAPMSVMTLPPPVAPTVSDIAPLASMNGYLSTFYLNSTVFFTRRLWKSRYYMLSGHFLYRFKSSELDSPVTDVMKLTPSSVVCVSDKFSGSQYCIEISGAASPVAAGGSSTFNTAAGAASTSGGLRSSSTANPALLANSAPTVWEAKYWYVQAASAGELKLWLAKLKAAVVRARYATRALPNPPMAGGNGGAGLSNGNAIRIPGAGLSPTRSVAVSSTSIPLSPTTLGAVGNAGPSRRASAAAVPSANAIISFGGNSSRTTKSKSMVVSNGSLRIGPLPPPPPPPLPPTTMHAGAGLSRRATASDATRTPTEDLSPMQTGVDVDNSGLGDYFANVGIPFRRAYSDQASNVVQAHPTQALHGSRHVATSSHSGRVPETLPMSSSTARRQSNTAPGVYGNGSGSSASSAASSPTSATDMSPAGSAYGQRHNLAPVHEDGRAERESR
ncbi:hypothetical protein THASP1DRAFT_32057 [Thamnocephalis sphaerospora]|uniref:PH domain-containing protein n=1 Tax=Thamnocephalis sphaerospora TaxID=78915 RepID=A0A4P9XL81_9FUNG|nr:hypothetical protein THASP1DRAFT_32057 [Thamnocephalis sphaerospora]|eukprot:RKP06121.1 hypothetical protein THASP1DRAFT_32057 [Thamnocephalis sphaerospora]